MEQLCWTCKNTNRFKCSWFEKNADVPDYVEIKNGFIVKCSKYNPINEEYKTITNKEIAKTLGISARTFYRKKEKWLKIYNDLYPPLPNVNFNKCEKSGQ